jgi:hypothetical protein
MFSSPLVRPFLLDRRVQERKGLHAFFYGDIPDLLQKGTDLTTARNPV